MLSSEKLQGPPGFSVMCLLRPPPHLQRNFVVALHV